MQSQMPLSPEQASNFAPQVDNLVYFMIAVCVDLCCGDLFYFQISAQDTG